jgi:hypothetical protein
MGYVISPHLKTKAWSWGMIVLNCRDIPGQVGFGDYSVNTPARELYAHMEDFISAARLYMRELKKNNTLTVSPGHLLFCYCPRSYEGAHFLVERRLIPGGTESLCFVGQNGKILYPTGLSQLNFGWEILRHYGCVEIDYRGSFYEDSLPFRNLLWQKSCDLTLGSPVKTREFTMEDIAKALNIPVSELVIKGK